MCSLPGRVEEGSLQMKSEKGSAGLLSVGPGRFDSFYHQFVCVGRYRGKKATNALVDQIIFHTSQIVHTRISTEVMPPGAIHLKVDQTRNDIASFQIDDITWREVVRWKIPSDRANRLIIDIDT